MHTHRRTRRVLAGFLAGAVLATTALFGSPAASAAPAPPASIAGLGDSITQAIMTCSSLSTCASNSWSTGSNATVQSHATRLKALNPQLAVYTNAVSGVNSGALLAQANKAVAQNAGYVTIEIGANDACTRTVSSMTNPDVFEGNIRAALTALTANGAQRQIFVASIPSLLNMYKVNAGSSSARLTWSLLQVCQSLLAYPSSVRQADVDRRAAVEARVVEYNNRLAKVCAEFATWCDFDDLAVYKTPFGKTHISTRDYFHPSLAGQALLASVTWGASRWVQ